MLFLSFILVSLFTSASMEDWIFRPANPANPLISSTDKSFKGTLVKKDQSSFSPTLIVSEAAFNSRALTSSSVESWLNQKYFDGKAIVLQRIQIEKDFKLLMIFQLREDRNLRIIPIYAFSKKNGRVLFLSMESTLKNYKEDLKSIDSLIKSVDI